MKILRYLYARFYQLMCDVGNGDIPILSSIMFMTFIITLHIQSVLLYYSIIFKPKGEWNFTANFALIQVFVVATLLYILLVYNGKSKLILEKFENETRNNRIKGRLIVVSYIIISMLILFFSFYLKMMQNRQN